METQLHVQTVIVGGGKKDADLGEKLCQISQGHCANLCGKTSLADLMALMPHFKLFITNDSGPMHLAWAQHTPVTALFGPTVRSLGFAPRGETSTVIEADVPCRPCGLHGHKSCPKGHFACMKNIDPAEVWSDVVRKLAAGAQE